jgi:hypothetical protein
MPLAFGGSSVRVAVAFPDAPPLQLIDGHAGLLEQTGETN